MIKKVCAKCKEVKPLDNFTRSKDRIQSYCITCNKERNKERSQIKDEWNTLFCGSGNWYKIYFG